MDGDGRSIGASCSSASTMTGNSKDDFDKDGQSQGYFPVQTNKDKSDEGGEHEGFSNYNTFTKLRGDNRDSKVERRRVTTEDYGSVDVSGKLNPIYIPSIINHIGSFLSCSDLKRCRRLNKQWHEECSKLLRVKGLVKFNSKAKLLHYVSQFKHKPNFCQNFCFELPKAVDADTERFFKKYGPFIKYFKLDFSSSTGNHCLTDKDFYDLIFVKLPNLEELSLVGCISVGDHFLPEGKRIEKEHQPGITSTQNSNPSSSSRSNSPTTSSALVDVHVKRSTNPSLPHLKTLEIFLCSASGENVSKHEFLIELLSCIPNLEKISVPKVPRMLSFGMPLLHTLITTEQLNFGKLQQLDMDIALYNGSIDILKSKGYPLKYLNAEINSTVSEDSLHSFLKTYEKTLHVLQLKFPRSPVASSELRLSDSFQVLGHLKLHGYKGSLKFLEQLVQLRTFGLIDNAFTIALRRPNFDKPLDVQFSYEIQWTDWTEESYCFDCMDSSDAQLLRKFSINFPNLRSLNLPHLNDFDLRIIYKHFSHSLQELTMDNPLWTDCGITGISNGIISDLKDIQDGQVEGYRTHPFIGSLKRLIKLEILTPSINMTDASIIYGIVFCENLKDLIFRNAPITDVGLMKLVDSMHLEHLETTMCANIRASGVKYALEKMTKREMTFIWNKFQNRLTACCVNRFLNGNEPVTCIIP